MALQVVSASNPRTRVRRTPNFPIAGIMKPYGLYPIMAHPVLPGETLNSAKCKWRVLSRPIKHPLAGAWLESWFVYVKFTDIDRELGNMFVSDAFSSTGYTAGADNLRTFTANGKIDWVQMCLKRFHEAYFVHENETPRTLDGVKQVKLNSRSWMANAMFRPAEVAVDTSDTFDQQAQLTAYQMMQMMSMSELTYEKYLQQFGVQSIRTSIGEPEILRFARSWIVPTNVINPADGTPASAWVWSDEMELAKDKRFDEPGFVVQFACIRPKMFAKYQKFSIVGNLWGFSDFFPIYNADDPSASVRVLMTGDTVFDAAANGAESSDEMFYDHNDVLNHGEQFVNALVADMPYALPQATVPNLLAAGAPEDMRGEYCTSTDIDALFVGSGASDKFCFYEGITQLSIAGHVKDLIR